MIIPVLLCGGSGTRLWPVSRRAYPKQFVPFFGPRSLFQEAAARFRAPGFSAPVVVTAHDFRFAAAEQLAALDLTPRALIVEPSPRNTAPAILAAALMLAEDDPEALLLVAPSDHLIADPGAFRAAVAKAAPQARSGALVTFGIVPTRAETGYGYLELAEGADSTAESPQPLARFVEKPPAEEAARMAMSGRHLWNAGIFLFTAAAIIAAFRRHAPDILAAVEGAVAGAKRDLDFLRLAPEPWARAQAISIDYAIMERTENLAVMPYRGAWSDLGAWDAVHEVAPQDAAGNATHGLTLALECMNTLLFSEDPRVLLVGLGLSDIVAVATKDAVLVADRRRAQRVKDVVARLEAEGRTQATEFPHDFRPWGMFERLVAGPRFQVKRIVVKPGGKLSLQSHHHRAEHWIVVEGTARVTIGDTVRLLSENESVFVPLGVVHRLENPGKIPLVLIEVQTGAYLGEDDIVRYEDVYARGEGARG